MSLLSAAKDEAWEEGGVKGGRWYEAGETTVMDKYVDTRITPFLCCYEGEEEGGGNEAYRDKEEVRMGRERRTDGDGEAHSIALT